MNKKDLCDKEYSFRGRTAAEERSKAGRRLRDGQTEMTFG